MCNRDLVSTGKKTRYNKLGITPLALSYMMRNQFYFDKTFSHCLSSYYCIAWSPKTLLSTMREGTIHHNHKTYDVIYHDTTAKAIAYCGLTHPNCHVKLSFRAAHSEFNVPNIVLVKLYKKTLLDT